MIEIGKKFGWALVRAQQTSRTQKEKYNTLADDAQTQMQRLQQAYETQHAYLFRSTAEKVQQAQETARQALAQRQAARAAHGVSGTSASAAEDVQSAQLTRALQQAQAQTQLQTQGAVAQKNFRTRWQQLLQAVRNYRRSARKKSRLGSLGQAVVSLFN